MKKLNNTREVINSAVKTIDNTSLKKDIDIEELLKYKIQEIEKLTNKILKKTS